jgi:hypothetical protein
VIDKGLTMKKFVKNNSLKLLCPVLLATYSGFGYSYTFNLSDYHNEFKIENTNVANYTSPMMTVNNSNNVFTLDSENRKWLHVSINRGQSPNLNVGRLRSLKTTKALLSKDGYDGHKGSIEAELKFTCTQDQDGYANEDSMARCRFVWPGFWLWADPREENGKSYKSAEIDIAEFQVQSDGNFTHSSHVLGAGTLIPNLTADYYNTNPHTIKYGLKWDCYDNYNSCKVSFWENGSMKKEITLNHNNSLENDVINAFEHGGFNIIFTQQFASYNGIRQPDLNSKTKLYNDFNRSSDMIVKSLSVTKE